jgi:hypothetical protein
LFLEEKLSCWHAQDKLMLPLFDMDLRSFKIKSGPSFEHGVEAFAFGNHQKEHLPFLVGYDIGNTVLLIGTFEMIRTNSAQISYKSLSNTRI